MIMEDSELLLSELLAVIHMDGGHYEIKYGTVKACEEAMVLVEHLREGLHDLQLAANVMDTREG